MPEEDKQPHSTPLRSAQGDNSGSKTESEQKEDNKKDQSAPVETQNLASPTDKKDDTKEEDKKKEAEVKEAISEAEKEAKKIQEETDELTFVSAVGLIEGQHMKEHLLLAREFFHKRLANLLPTDFEGRGICFYYLLKIDLQRGLTTETEAQRRLFKNMRDCFQKREDEIVGEYKKKKKDLITKMQMIAFYKLMEGYFGATEYLFDKHDAIDLVELSYEAKMNFRKDRFLHEKKFLKWIEYSILKLTCRYGNSFGRWGFTGVFFIIFFASLYAITDPSQEMIISSGANFYDYFYFSVVTFTTLGYGDVLPLTGFQKLFVAIEVFLGYIQLGLFLTLIQKKL